MKTRRDLLRAVFTAPPKVEQAPEPPAVVKDAIRATIAPPLSDRDRDILIRTLFGEALGQLPEGRAAVVHVARNRAIARGTDAATECLRPWQFSCWNKGDPNLPRMQEMPRESHVYRELGKVVDEAWAAPDSVAGARHYFNPAVAQPAWAKPPGRRVRIIGAHEFWAGVP